MLAEYPDHVEVDVDGSPAAMIFKTYVEDANQGNEDGYRLVETYRLSRQMFCDDGHQAINHGQVEDAIADGTADQLFDQLFGGWLSVGDCEYSRDDWYGQLCRLLQCL